MSSDWDEIKRLAADFQKAQLTSTLQKLSEHNCVELVSLLQQKNLLHVIFTNDGKEYITVDQLEREIRDELYANAGRVNLVEVSKTLNVDLSVVENAATRISNTDVQLHLLLGQLVSEDYITHLAEEINEKLSQKGEISISDLTQYYDLPSDFLQRDVVEKHLGKIIRGRQDPANPRLFFTQAYIQRCKAKIRGALAAITRPTNVASILQQINVQEKVFHSVLDEVAPAGHVTSKLANAQYVPNIYAKMQIDWVTNFYKQNGFLEYEALQKLGISDAKNFIKKQFPNEDFVFLKRCAISAKTIELNVLAALNECQATKSYVDLSTILPSNMSDDDIEELFTTLMTQKNYNVNSFVFLENIVFSQQFLAELTKPSHEMALLNAKLAIDNGVYQQYFLEKQLATKAAAGNAPDALNDSKADKRDERRKKAASGKAGGGSQGRETKTKSTKKHARGGRTAAQDDSDDDEANRAHFDKSGKKSTKILELVKVIDIAETIYKPLETEGLEHLANVIAQLHHQQLNQIAIAKAQELFEASPQTDRRKTHSAVQEHVNTLLVQMRLFEKGLKLFSGDVQNQLLKYLLKTLGNDLCNELIVYIANESNLTVKSTNLNVDQRNKLAQECDAEYRAPLLELNKSLNKTLEEFILAVEAVLKSCSMIIKKADKRKDRQLILQHKETLLEQLQSTTETAMLLHLSALILFTSATGCILHASGKFVPTILEFLRAHLNNSQFDLLMKFQLSFLNYLQLPADSEEAKLLNEKLLLSQEELKTLAATYEKPGVTKAD